MNPGRMSAVIEAIPVVERELTPARSGWLFSPRRSFQQVPLERNRHARHRSRHDAEIAIVHSRAADKLAARARVALSAFLYERAHDVVEPLAFSIACGFRGPSNPMSYSSPR